MMLDDRGENCWRLGLEQKLKLRLKDLLEIGEKRVHSLLSGKKMPKSWI